MSNIVKDLCLKLKTCDSINAFLNRLLSRIADTVFVRSDDFFMIEITDFSTRQASNISVMFYEYPCLIISFFALFRSILF